MRLTPVPPLRPRAQPPLRLRLGERPPALPLTASLARRTGARPPTRALATLGLLGLAAPAAYTVQPGDTLSEVARDHGVSQQALARANEIDDPDRLVAGAELSVPSAPAAGSSAGDERPVDRGEAGALLTEAARRHGWSPRLVKALAWQESGWQQGQVSRAGAVGIMQVMPGTGRFVSQRLAGRSLDLADPRDNVEAGVLFLQHLWELTDGDIEATLAGYYQGLGSVREHGMYADTERYVANVLALRDRF